MTSPEANPATTVSAKASGAGSALELENQKLRSALSSLSLESRETRKQFLHLQSRLGELETELRASRSMVVELQTELIGVEQDLERSSLRFREAEAQHDKLASLYVAIYRLSESTTREELFFAIQEIVINLVGSERFAIFEQRGELLDVASSFGLSQRFLSELRVETGPIERALRKGESQLPSPEAQPGDDATQEPPLAACVPLLAGEDTVGVLAIFSLLDHKRGFEPIDHELLDLLSRHAGSTLKLTQPLPSTTPNAEARVADGS